MSVSHAIALLRLLVKAGALRLVPDGTRGNVADLRLRLRRDGHRLCAITATSPDSDMHRRHQYWWYRHH